MKKQKIEPAIVTMAIEELQKNNQKVTVAAVSKETGYPIPSLYASGLLKNFITPRPVVNRSPKEIKSASFYRKTAIEQTVEGYIEEIKSSYFFHPELLDDVKEVMNAMHIDFQSSLFDRAINSLQVMGQLNPLPLKPGYLIGSYSNEDEPAKPDCNLLQASFMLYDSLTGQQYNFDNEESYELKIEELCKSPNVNLKSFKAHEVVRIETIRKKINGGAA